MDSHGLTPWQVTQAIVWYFANHGLRENLTAAGFEYEDWAPRYWYEWADRFQSGLVTWFSALDLEHQHEWAHTAVSHYYDELRNMEAKLGVR